MLSYSASIRTIFLRAGASSSAIRTLSLLMLSIFLCGQITKESRHEVLGDMDGENSVMKGRFWRGSRIVDALHSLKSRQANGEPQRAQRTQRE